MQCKFFVLFCFVLFYCFCCFSLLMVFLLLFFVCMFVLEMSPVSRGLTNVIQGLCI